MVYISPVSYTHLDVYKRQVYTNCLKRICTRSKLLMNIKKIGYLTIGNPLGITVFNKLLLKLGKFKIK